MTRKSVYQGCRLILKDGTTALIINVDGNKYLLSSESYYARKLEECYSMDLGPKQGHSEIAEIRNENDEVIWTEWSNKTVEEIEILLGKKPGSIRFEISQS